ncbi:MAG TPA: hypothetical protein VE953_05145 [Terriglobales bacterium]|nr:hypothetical protein [Terriglobales bacterium]
MTIPKVNLTQIGLAVLFAAGLVSLLALLLAGLGVIGTYTVHQCITGAVSGPPKQPAPPPFDPPLLGWSGLVILVCGLGFVAGDVWGYLRAAGHAQAGPTSGLASTGLQLLLVGLFGFGVAALAYETYAVSGVAANPDRWPITYYVRCAYVSVSAQTLLGAFVVSTLVGHWLGYQARVELKED